MFYIHPWGLDDWKPDLAAPRLQLIRTFARRKSCWGRMSALFDEFTFRPVRETLEELAEN